MLLLLYKSDPRFFLPPLTISILISISLSTQIHHYVFPNHFLLPMLYSLQRQRQCCHQRSTLAIRWTPIGTFQPTGSFTFSPNPSTNFPHSNFWYSDPFPSAGAWRSTIHLPLLPLSLSLFLQHLRRRLWRHLPQDLFICLSIGCR